MTHITVYRLLVGAQGFKRGRTSAGRGANHRGAKSAIEPMSYGFVGWTADQAAEPWRLAGSGTFCYLGAIRAVTAARRYLRESKVTHVSLRNNQDQRVLSFYKQLDGRVTCYAEGN